MGMKMSGCHKGSAFPTRSALCHGVCGNSATMLKCNSNCCNWVDPPPIRHPVAKPGALPLGVLMGSDDRTFAGLLAIQLAGEPGGDIPYPDRLHRRQPPVEAELQQRTRFLDRA